MHAVGTRQSFALDLLRGSAAITVFLHHCNWLSLDGGWLSVFRRDVAHSAVTVFFVLSGYVIAASLDSKPTTATDFFTKRASRIYSVAIPALLLTVILDLVGDISGLSPDLGYELRRPIIYLGIAGVFIGDIWGLSESAFSNTPFWSLGYEVWYYVIFGIAVFGRGVWAWLGVAAVLAFVGPKLCLLLPVWLGGVLAYRAQRRIRVSIPAARWLSLSIVILMVLTKCLRWDEPLNLMSQGLVPFPLRFSQWFLGDYWFGLLTTGLVYALAFAEWPSPELLAGPVKWVAGISFSLYLVHFPMLALLGRVLPNQGWIAIGATAVVSVAFGLLFEPQKTRVRRWMWLVIRSRDRLIGRFGTAS